MIFGCCLFFCFALYYCILCYLSSPFLVVFSAFWALPTIENTKEMELQGFRILVVGDSEDKICCLMLEDNFWFHTQDNIVKEVQFRLRNMIGFDFIFLFCLLLWVQIFRCFAYSVSLSRFPDCICQEYSLRHLVGIFCSLIYIIMVVVFFYTGYEDWLLLWGLKAIHHIAKPTCFGQGREGKDWQLKRIEWYLTHCWANSWQG